MTNALGSHLYNSLKEPRYDVTSDVLCAVKDKIGIGNEVTVECNGVPQYRISILPITQEPRP